MTSLQFGARLAMRIDGHWDNKELQKTVAAVQAVQPDIRVRMIGRGRDELVVLYTGPDRAQLTKDYIPKAPADWIISDKPGTYTDPGSHHVWAPKALETVVQKDPGLLKMVGTVSPNRYLSERFATLNITA